MGINVGIIGVTGYVGLELTRILSGHPEVDRLSGISKDYAGRRLDQVYPHQRGVVDLVIDGFEKAGELISSSDVIFTALPHGLSAPLARQAIGQGKLLIDLAADFRLPEASVYEKWYGQPHGAPELLPQAVYGLSELYRDKIKQASLIANPGCYPTCSLLALAPLLKEGLIEPEVIIDAKSGVSGAGRSAVAGNLFSECNENVKAYGVGKHRHTPEIACWASDLAGQEVEITFTPHLIPMTRGMLATIYTVPRGKADARAVLELYHDFYRHDPFIEVAAGGESPQTNWVRGTNRCYLGAAVSGKRLILLSAIDNLVKGAAGQGVQNMNIRCGFKEDTGLAVPGLYL